jgi:hypothetical protein
VWLGDDVAAGAASDPFLHAGDAISAYFAHRGAEPVTLTIEWDRKNNGEWEEWAKIELPAAGGRWVNFASIGPNSDWIRMRARQALTGATALFTYGYTHLVLGRDEAAIFAGVAAVGDERVLAGTVRARGENKRALHFAPVGGDALYELDAELKLTRVEDAAALRYHRENSAIPAGVLAVDAASVLYTDDAGRRWRLPKGDAGFDRDSAAGPARVCREVCTERDLFNAHGTFYELPAENAGGFAKVRPIASHHLRVHDYCSWRGLLVLSGVDADARAGEHIVRSADGQAALWLGAIDDLWKLGAPRGVGGPWKDAAVEAGKPSDPYLAWGYNRRTLHLSHGGAPRVTFKIELDVTGDGLWSEWKTFAVTGGQTVEAMLPLEVQARWLRVTADQATTATAMLTYE